MTVRERQDRVGTVTGLRTGLLCLAAVAAFGTAVELATERHWDTPVQLLAWLGLAMATAAIVLVGWRPQAVRVCAGRVLAVLVLLMAAFGVWEHVEANLHAGWLDAVHGTRWGTLPVAAQWWYALSKTVGPAPPLAPGALAQVSLLVLLAAWRHPADAAE